MKKGARQLNVLTDLKIRKLKYDPSTNKPVYLADGGGLRIRADQRGKYWVYRFKMPNQNKDIVMGLGHYPQVSLEDARKLRDEYNVMKKNGVNPMVARDESKNRNLERYDDSLTFSIVFEKMVAYKTKKKNWSEAHIKRYRSIFNNYLNKFVGNLNLHAISEGLLIGALRNITENPIKLRSGKVDTEKYDRQQTLLFAKTIINLVYQHADEFHAYKQGNPLPLKHSLYERKKPKSHKAVHQEDLGHYWHKIKGLETLQDKVFMMVDLITALRVGSLARVKWRMFNPSKKILALPKELLKTDINFTTPLPQKLVDDLLELKKMTGGDKDDFIFTNRSGDHYSINRPRLLVKSFGFDATAHGNRTILKLNASKYSGISNFAIEYQLSHTPTKDKVEKAYMSDDDWLNERRQLVDWFYNWLEQQEESYLKVQNIGKTNARASV